MKRPDIYTYYSYRDFLKDWVSYMKATQSGFSIRSLAQKAGIATGYISSVTGGKRRLTKKTLEKLSPYLRLNATELSYLGKLIELENSNSSDLKSHALRKMNRFSTFRKLNKQELKVSQYLSKWYYVAIREMLNMDGFRLDPDWIRKRLAYQVPKENVKKAIKFLIENKFIVLNPDGSLGAAGDDIECFDTIYSMSLKQYYKQMMDRAKEALDTVDSEDRYVLGYTFCLDDESLTEARQIMNSAFKKIRSLQKNKVQKDVEVYNFSTFAVPLTSREGEE